MFVNFKCINRSYNVRMTSVDGLLLKNAKLEDMNKHLNASLTGLQEKCRALTERLKTCIEMNKELERKNKKYEEVMKEFTQVLKNKMDRKLRI